MRHSHNAVSMLGQRRRRWASIETALCECLVFAGMERVGVNYYKNTLKRNSLLCVSIRSVVNSKFMPRGFTAYFECVRFDPSKHEIFPQCCFDVGPTWRRWANIKTTLGTCLVFAVMVHIMIRHQPAITISC